MICYVKKRNFFIYFLMLLVGVMLIVISILFHHFKLPEMLYVTFLNIGCGFIPSAIVAYLIDSANETREVIRIKELRESFLRELPHGIMMIAKVIIEKYYPFDKVQKDITFFNCFNDAFSKMKEVVNTSENIKQRLDERNEIIRRLDNGICLYLRDSKSVLDHNYELTINSIFTQNEMSTIQSLREDCMNILNSFVIIELADSIKQLIESAYNNIDTVKTRLDRNIILGNHYIKNWYEIIQ